MYNIHGYGSMILDRGRTAAYAAALRARIRPGSVVMDIGTGTGIMAFLACQFGARKVYAIEPDGVIQLAREAAAANGFADRIEFIPKLSTELDLAEQVDGIVADLRGVVPPFQQGLSSMMDARNRFLAPGGWMIPQRDTLWAAPVEMPAVHDDLVSPWDSDGYGLDLKIFRKKVVNGWRQVHAVPANALVSRPACWAEIDYRTFSDPNLRGDIDWTIEHARAAHGICVWFDAETAEGIGFSNSPLSEDQHIYGRAFFPWPDPVQLGAGDHVHVALRANLVGSDYVWCWNTTVHGEKGDLKADFRQSTFQGEYLSRETLRRCSHLHQPRLNQNGHIDRLILDRMSAGLPLAEIARELSAGFPHSFATWEKALTRVGELSVKYSEN